MKLNFTKKLLEKYKPIFTKDTPIDSLLFNWYLVCHTVESEGKFRKGIFRVQDDGDNITITGTPRAIESLQNHLAIETKSIVYLSLNHNELITHEYLVNPETSIIDLAIHKEPTLVDTVCNLSYALRWVGGKIQERMPDRFTEDTL